MTNITELEQRKRELELKRDIKKLERAEAVEQGVRSAQARVTAALGDTRTVVATILCWVGILAAFAIGAPIVFGHGPELPGMLLWAAGAALFYWRRRLGSL